MTGNDAAMESSVTPDVMMMTGGDAGPEASTEAGGREGGTDAADAAAPGVCSASRVIDLSMRGMTTMVMGVRTTRYTGTTDGASDNQEITPPPNCLGGTNGIAIRQVAHTYRVQAAGFLRVTTVNPGTPGPMNAHDTVVFLQTACQTRGATQLACNDDTSGTDYRSTTTTAMPVMAGQMVTIVVADWANMAGMGMGDAYELSIQELPQVAMGMPCNPNDVDLCVDTATCVGLRYAGTCTANGSMPNTRCRPATAMTRCDGTMTCLDDGNGVERCYNARMDGQACNAINDRCGASSECIAATPGNQIDGVCAAIGAAGTGCGGDSATTCATGLTCSDMANGGVCQRPVMGMESCSVFGALTCAMGSACVPGATAGQYQCAMPGAAAGTACVDGAMRCSGSGLVCTTMTGAGSCVTSAMMGAACNPGFPTALCVAGTACRATNYTTGTCQPPVAEATTAHASAMAAQMIPSLPAVIRGGLPMGNNVDCYSFTVPANANLFAMVSDGNGACPTGADPLMAVYDSMGRQIDFADDSNMNRCPVIDGRSAGSNSGRLEAGTYSICVGPYVQGGMSTPIPTYFLSIATN